MRSDSGPESPKPPPDTLRILDKGRITIAAMALGDDPEALLRDLQDRFPRAELLAGDADYEALVAQVVGWMARPGADLGLPLDIRGTAFQQRVWQALRDIPSGHTVSYRELAARIGAPRAVRAVASACLRSSTSTSSVRPATATRPSVVEMAVMSCRPAAWLRAGCGGR